jgi:hypothetical protein
MQKLKFYIIPIAPFTHDIPISQPREVVEKSQNKRGGSKGT